MNRNTLGDMRKSLSKKGESPVLLARIPRELLAAVKARAKREGRSISEITRLALEGYLETSPRPKEK